MILIFGSDKGCFIERQAGASNRRLPKQEAHRQSESYLYCGRRLRKRDQIKLKNVGETMSADPNVEISSMEEGQSLSSSPQELRR